MDTQVAMPTIAKHFNYSFNYIIETKDKLANWDGWCGQLAMKVSAWLEKQNIHHNVLVLKRDENDNGGAKQKYLYPSMMPREWYYHVVVEVNGIIHDPWFMTPVSRDEYLQKMFPSQVVQIKYNIASNAVGDLQVSDIDKLTTSLMY